MTDGSDLILEVRHVSGGYRRVVSSQESRAIMKCFTMWILLSGMERFWGLLVKAVPARPPLPG